MLVRRIHQNIHRLIRSRAARGDVGRRARITGVTDPRAGQPAAPSDLVDVASLVTAYYTLEPDPADPAQQVAFGTSGHRGSAIDRAFNQAHPDAPTPATRADRVPARPRR